MKSPACVDRGYAPAAFAGFNRQTRYRTDILRTQSKAIVTNTKTARPTQSFFEALHRWRH